MPLCCQWNTFRTFGKRLYIKGKKTVLYREASRAALRMICRGVRSLLLIHAKNFSCRMPFSPVTISFQLFLDSKGHFF